MDIPTYANGLETKPKTGRQSSGFYRVKITLGVDLSCVELNGDAAHLVSRATVPPLLETYANDNHQTMPDGLYGFFGDDSELSLKSQIEYDLKMNGGQKEPIWDLSATLAFKWASNENRPKAATMAWKDPRDLQGAFIRIGRISGETNDLLRHFTGDRKAVDRLTLEPWRIDAYAAALEVVYGPIRAVIFDAMMANGEIHTVVKVYDPTLIEGEELKPLYRFLSSHDPDQPRVYTLPDASWVGWKKATKELRKLDIADIKTFIAQPRDDKQTREILTRRRLRMLKEEGRFVSREKEIRYVASRRKEKTIAKGASETEGTSYSVTGRSTAHRLKGGRQPEPSLHH